MVKEETPTIRVVGLEVADRDFSFKSGQWVDFFIPGVSAVGGYSITSTPEELPSIQLAVRRSAHPSAAWVHGSAVGDKVSIAVGGKFTLRSATRKIVMVAGGIGITPLISILRQAVKENPDLDCKFFYSVRKEEELAFAHELQRIGEKNRGVSVDLIVTRPTYWQGPSARVGRHTLEQCDPDSDVYLCGPPEMTDQMLSNAKALGFKNIFFEKWW